MSIDNLINRALVIEEKAIRKVRTVEGSRMYGQPIGTIITRDMIERAKRKRAREKAKNQRNGDSSRSADASEASSSSSKRSTREIEKEISHIEEGIAKLKAKPDTGVESTRKRRERLIAKSEARIKELQGSLGESSNSKKVFATRIKKGDKVLDEGKWKTVERTDSWKGRQKVWFTDDTQTSFGHNEKASLWMDDDEASEHNKRASEAETARKKAEEDKKKAEKEKQDANARLGRKGSELKVGDALDDGTDEGAVISRIEGEGANRRIFFEGNKMPKGMKVGDESIVKLKDTSKSEGSTSKPSAGRNKPSPIPEDFTEPGLPGMSKFKSKAESNRKRHEKLLAKMYEGSEVVDEKNRRSFYKASTSQYGEGELYWQSDDPNDDKKYSDAELAEELKGTADFSYTHMNEDGELVKEHWGKPENIMGGTTQPVEARPNARKKPSEPKDGGSTSEPEFRELRAGIIREGDLIRHKGEWKKVEFAESNSGKVMLSLEGVAEDLIVPIDRAFEVQYPGGKKPAKGEPKQKRKPGTSLFGGAKKPSEPKPEENKLSLKRMRADKIKEGDTFYDSDGDKHVAKEVNISGGSVNIRTEGGSSFLLPDWESLYVEDDDPDANADFDLTVPKGASKAEVDEWDSQVEAYNQILTLEADNPVKEATKKEVLGFSRQAIERLRKKIEEQVAKRKEANLPANSTLPVTGFADGGDVYIEPRPLTGDEVTKRSEEYEEQVAKEVAEWRAKTDRLKENLGYAKKVSIDEIADLEVFDGSKIPTSEADLKWKVSPKSKDVELAQWGGVTLVRDKTTGYISTTFGTQEISVKNQSRYDVQDYDMGERLYKFKPDGFKVIAKDHNMKKFLKEEPPKRVKRSDVPFWDYWNGIRGMDWMNEGESEQDYEALVDRKLKAKEETARLGVKIGTGLNVEMHEVINSVLDTYKERYPGVLEIIDTFALDNDPNANAWLGSARPMRGVEKTNKPLVMGLNPNGFGKTQEDNNNWWLRQSESWEFTGYKVGGDRTALAEKIGVTPSHLTAMYTFNHEMGHAIGHMIMGQTSINGRFASLGYEDRAKSKERMERYSARLTPIMRKYGVLVNDGDEIKDHIDVSDFMSTADKKLLGKVSIFNKTKLSAHLSGYGAYNWHEIMAESWASYSMDENPTEFSLEMGEAMEDLLLEIMEEHGYADAPEEKGISLRGMMLNKLYALGNN